MLMLGPSIEQQEETLLKPFIERTFAIMNRNGLLPEPPQEIQGQPLQIEYVSILAQAQKAVATTSIREWVGLIGEMAQAFPEALLKVNATEVVDHYGELLGIPVKLIRSDKGSRRDTGATGTTGADGTGNGDGTTGCNHSEGLYHMSTWATTLTPCRLCLAM